MLYFYKQIDHQINNMHKYMDFFFMRLFDGSSVNYDHRIYIHAEFQTIIDDYDDLDKKLENVVVAFMGLTDPADKLKIQKAYYVNNAIQQVCDKKFQPIKFTDLPEQMQDCLKDLYGSKGILYSMLTHKTGYAAVKKRCGSLKGHFEKFREENKISVCPFCGMETLLNEHDELKNEYDHYLSKGHYPFCSINFNNLVPICDYCNKSGNKGQKDIPFQPGITPPVQEELYYPYDSGSSAHEITLTINSTSTDLKDIDNWTLSIDCKPRVNIKRKDRWVEIYNIASRYKARIAGDSYQWKDRIITKYALRCKRRHMPFSDFKADIMDDFSDYQKLKDGILRKCFDEFIMNDSNCEANLAGNIF